MPRRSTTAESSTDSPVNAALPRRRRGRQSRVSAIIETLLAASPLDSQALLKQGKFSQAALYLNLAALRKAGKVHVRRNGHERIYSLSSATDFPVVEAKAIFTHSTADQPVPIDRLQEKLLVLRRLAGSMPSPISELLRSAGEDLTRLAS